MGPPPLPPKHTGSRDYGHSTIHFRRSSTVDDDGEVQPFLPRSTGSPSSSVETVVDLDDVDYRSPATGEKGEYYKSRRQGSETKAGYLTWEDRSARRRKGSKTCLWIMLLFCVGAGGWLVGLMTKDAPLPATVAEAVLRQREVKLPCNPYEQHGVLQVNLTVASENRWEPIGAPRSCEPIDYLSLLWNVNNNDMAVAETEFLRNRTIVLLGDSVDRDHNEHFCHFVGGQLEMIGVEHPLSPPYPEGQELPPEDYKNPWTGKREWPSFVQSRPFVCHVYKYNFRVMNVFHYGFRDRTSMIEHHPHYYPPARLEDRIDQIVIPILEGLARTYNVPAEPDLFSLTPGYWGLLRSSVEIDKNKAELIKQGVSEAEASKEFDVWQTMSREKREWNQKRTEEVLRHTAKKWPLPDGQHEMYRKPKILWRTLHHIKEHHNLPFNRIAALDEIGRATVDKLIAEGKAAEAGEKSWKAWTLKLQNRLGFKKGSVPQPESEALAGGLGHRLKLDRWGDLLLGQENHFRDDVHPLPLPGSFLYGNMLLRQLADAVREREGLKFVYEEDLAEEVGASSILTSARG